MPNLEPPPSPIRGDPFPLSAPLQGVEGEVVGDAKERAASTDSGGGPFVITVDLSSGEQDASGQDVDDAVAG